ncbi:hypothetical protein Godav_009898, partial [Gossypium davidsonii]|nr:hypothetical protein [Gossypium davidsonii]
MYCSPFGAALSTSSLYGCR